jgi:branched-chain amino acid transport system substrate-binding protein
LKKNRYLLLPVVLLLVGLLAAGCGGAKDTSNTAGGDTIKIGFLGGKTGGHAHYGIETLKGMQMAVEDVNSAGGVNGKKLEIIEGDHGSNSSEAANVTQKLITQKVSAIVGDPTTGITKVAAQICQPSKVVLLSAGAVGPGIVEIGDYIYRDTLLDAVAAPAVTKYLTEELKWKKVALVTTTGLSYSEGLTNIFKPALAKYEIEIVAEQSIMEKDTNFSAQVTALSKKEFDGVVFTGYYTEGALFMNEMRKQGLKQVMVGGDGLLGKELYQLGEKAVAGSMLYAGFAVDTKNAAGKTREFIEKYQSRNNGAMPDMFPAQGYDAVLILAEAMKAAQSSDPTVFKDKLAQTKDFKGVTGTITFDAKREPIKSPVYLMEVKDSPEYPVKAVIPITG